MSGVAPYDGAVAVAPSGSSLVSDPIARVVWRVGLPAVGSNLLMIVFSVTDAFWVGQRLGAIALAAVTTSLFWIWLFISVGEMIEVGLTALASRRHGEGRPEEAALAVGDALIYALGLGCLVALAGTIALPSLFAAMHTPAEVTALGKIYLGTYLLGAPGIFCYFAVDAGFRASGDTRTPLLLLASSVAITLVLDPVLILGLAGAPRLGLAGAAIATVSVRGAACVAGVVLLVRRRMVRFHGERVAQALRKLVTISSVGAPTALTGVLFSLIYVVITRTASLFGTPALAAMGLGFRVESWIYVIGVGFGAAAAAIVGQNLGAGDTARAERAGWITVGFALVPASLAAAAELLVPTHLARFFTPDPTVIQETAHYLRIAALSQLCVGAEVILEGAMGGAGDTVPPMIWSTTCTASRVPLCAWAAARWGTGGLWTVISATAALRGLGMATLWKIGWWKKRRV
ncbi:MAG TPA: MATE family efflux transporter [Gemmatimonadaceae bacterium]|nr:MATE family efflux transporter [Gemmatimonadaceae bacterium]